LGRTWGGTGEAQPRFPVGEEGRRGWRRRTRLLTGKQRGGGDGQGRRHRLQDEGGRTGGKGGPGTRRRDVDGLEEDALGLFERLAVVVGPREVEEHAGVLVVVVPLEDGLVHLDRADVVLAGEVDVGEVQVRVRHHNLPLRVGGDGLLHLGEHTPGRRHVALLGEDDPDPVGRVRVARVLAQRELERVHRRAEVVLPGLLKVLGLLPAALLGRERDQRQVPLHHEGARVVLVEVEQLLDHVVRVQPSPPLHVHHRCANPPRPLSARDGASPPDPGSPPWPAWAKG